MLFKKIGMKRCSLGVILLAALALRLILLYVNQAVFTLPAGGGDALSFERLSWSAATQGQKDLLFYLTSSSKFIVLIGSTIYSVFGRHPALLGGIMVAIGLGTVAVVYKASLELWNDQYVARMAAWVASLFPQLALHSVLFLREIPVSFCVACAVLCLIRYVRSNKLRFICGFVAFIMVAALFHSAVIVALPGLLLGTILARPQKGQGKTKYYIINLGAAIVIGLVIYLANATGVGLGKFGGGIDSALDTFEQGELRDTRGGAAFPEWMRIRGGISDAWKIPVRLVSFLFAPIMPFMIRSPSHLLGALDALIYIYIFWLVFRSWHILKRKRIVIILFTVTLVLCTTYSLGVSNFGTAIRHRAKFAPMLIILTSGLPLLLREEKRRRRRTISSGQIDLPYANQLTRE